MPKLLKCMPSFPTCFLESRDFFHVNLIVSSSLQKFPTMLFALDPLLGRLYLQVMIFKITNLFVVDLTLLASSMIFSATTSRDSSILRLFVPQCIVIPSGLKYRYDLKCHYSIIVRASWKTNLKSGKKNFNFENKILILETRRKMVLMGFGRYLIILAMHISI